MIYPKENRLIHWFFHHYILWIVRRNFREVNYNTVAVDAGKSVFLLANHFSWWDGFLMYYINQKVFKKRFNVMVIEETVRKVSFLKYMGAFSIQKNSRDVVTSLDHAAKLLQDPANLVLIFPQGKLYSNFLDEVTFEKGLQRVILKAAGKYQPVMAATFIENMQYKKPGVNVYLKNQQAVDGAEQVKDLQQAYRQHYQTAKAQQTKTAV